MYETLKRLRLSVALLALCLLTGTIGFELLGRDLFHAFYLTVVILTTVGMEGAETDAERAFSLLLMVVGVGAVLYATGTLVAFFVEGQINDLFGRRKMTNRIDALSGHYVVIGAGRMGHALCMSLQSRGVEFVLIERDEEHAEAARRAGMLALCGDGTDERLLFQAHIDRAAGLATCLPGDADNVFVTLTARGLSETLHITARAEDVATERKLVRAGANRVVCAALLGASRIADLMMNPKVEELIDLDGHWPDLEISRLAAAQVPGAEGHRIADLLARLGESSSVVALVTVDGMRRLRPDREHVLRAGDELVIVGEQGCASQLLESGGRVAA